MQNVASAAVRRTVQCAFVALTKPYRLTQLCFSHTACTKQVDLVLVIDSSGSQDENGNRLVNLARKIVYGFDVDNGLVQVGAVFFSNTVNYQFYLNSFQRSRESVVTALGFYGFGGSTNTSGALNEVRLNQFTAAKGARFGVDKVGVEQRWINCHVNCYDISLHRTLVVLLTQFQKPARFVFIRTLFVRIWLLLEP